MITLKSILQRSLQLYGVLTVFAVAIAALALTAMSSTQTASAQTTASYPIVDTGQTTCYDNSELIDCPAEGEAFYGQDAQFAGNTPSYTDNGDGTITDNVTDLVWTQDQSEQSMDWSEAPNYCEALTTGDITDWRVPNIKELWSIRDFSTGWPWVDTDYFHLVGEDSAPQVEGALQHTWSSNYYLVDTEEAVDNVAFIVNDWTGHIKALSGRRYARCVSGDEYGLNDYVDNGDSTVTDAATGLMWTQDDSGEAMNWEAALAYAEASTDAGYADWRLPNVKELQSIADYSGVFPAIDSTLFNLTGITNEAGNADYPYYWTNTSNPYIDPNDEHGYWYAWYVAAGYAVDANGNDTHGAGAVRFDTKSEDGADGPDGERYYNYVRLVRDAEIVDTPDLTETIYLPLVNNTETESTAATSADSNAVDEVVASEDVMPATAMTAAVPTAAPAAPQASASQSEGFQSGTVMDQPISAGQAPDLASIAAELGVTEAALQAALGDPNQDRPDFASIAAELGVTEEALVAALGLPAEAPPTDGQRPGGGPPSDAP